MITAIAFILGMGIGLLCGVIVTFVLLMERRRNK